MSWISSIGRQLYFGVIDYLIYFVSDLVVRRRLAVARTDKERCRIWQKMSGVLLLVSVVVAWFHHTPYFLWFLVLTTILLTIPLQFRYQSTFGLIWHRFVTWIKYWCGGFSFLIRQRPKFQQQKKQEIERFTVRPRQRVQFDSDFLQDDQPFSMSQHGPLTPSPIAFNCAIAECSPLSRRALHGHTSVSERSPSSSGYGEGDFLLSLSSSSTRSTPTRPSVRFATSTPLEALRTTQRSVDRPRY